ncbi:hypothetical protein [Hydrogenophaga sp. OTU3427]|uniref:hypothetical protein n=1 Tax=Hydrogenophaga sp. OTU3427 TaxID=3043856 RepID=UPI00313BB4A4
MRPSSVLDLGMRPQAILSGAVPARPRSWERQGLAWVDGRPVNVCHQCGASAYRPVLARDAQGAMRPNGRYRCVSCKLEFAHIHEFRGVLLAT